MQDSVRNEILKYTRKIKCGFVLRFILIVARLLALEMQGNVGSNCRKSTFETLPKRT